MAASPLPHCLVCRRVTTAAAALAHRAADGAGTRTLYVDVGAGAWNKHASVLAITGFGRRMNDGIRRDGLLPEADRPRRHIAVTRWPGKLAPKMENAGRTAGGAGSDRSSVGYR